MLDGFQEFQKKSHIIYPPFAIECFESYFYNYMLSIYPGDNSYLPVFWTEASHRSVNIPQLQNLLNNLPKIEKYFSVVQHVEGLQMSVPPKTLVFSMSCPIGIPLPLTYENPNMFEKYANVPKTIFCSFVGANTHPIRVSAIKALSPYPDVVCKIDSWTNKISAEAQTLFLDITSKSKFTLAPRGYGRTSFRLYEALNMGSVPVYIYDDPWLPYTDLLDWNKLAVLIHYSEISNLYARLKNITDDDYTAMLEYYNKHKYLFTFEGMSNYVVSKNAELNI